MRYSISILFFTFIFITSTNSQFSIGTGLTQPVGSFQNDEGGAAKIGYQISVAWDKAISKNFGIASGLQFGQNDITESSINYSSDSWNHLAIGTGLYFEPIANLKIKGLLNLGLYAVPVVHARQNVDNNTSGTVIIFPNIAGIRVNKLSPGFNLSMEYKINNYYIGTNLLYTNPNLNIEPISQINDHVITNIGWIFGYVF